MEKDEIIRICTEANSMSEAARIAGIDRRKLVGLAIKYGCYKPNMGGKGIKKTKSIKISLDDIFNGKYKGYNRVHLKRRLIEEKIKENKCELCGISEWQGNPLSLQLHHKDGDINNNSLENLQLLCPNCHSQTETFSGKNTRKNSKEPIKENNKDYNFKIKLKEIEIKKQLLLQSNINFLRFGWVNEAAKIIKCSPQNVNKWMKMYMIDFYNEKCFKRNNCPIA